MVSRTNAAATRDRLDEFFLVALVVVVQMAWGGGLVYLGFFVL